MVVLSLGGWSPQIHTGFHVAGATRENVGRVSSFAYRAITLCRQSFQTCSARFDLADSLGTLRRSLTHPTTPNTQHSQAYTYSV